MRLGSVEIPCRKGPSTSLFIKVQAKLLPYFAHDKQYGDTIIELEYDKLDGNIPSMSIRKAFALVSWGENKTNNGKTPPRLYLRYNATSTSARHLYECGR